MDVQTATQDTDLQRQVFGDNITAIEATPIEGGKTIDLSDLSLSLDAAQQGALDRVLDHLNQSGLMPVFEIKGDLISLTLELNRKFLDILPDHLVEDGKSVMERVTTALCDYANATGFGGFGLRMEFKK